MHYFKEQAFNKAMSHINTSSMKSKTIINRGSKAYAFPLCNKWRDQGTIKFNQVEYMPINAHPKIQLNPINLIKEQIQ